MKLALPTGIDPNREDLLMLLLMQSFYADWSFVYTCADSESPVCPRPRRDFPVCPRPDMTHTWMTKDQTATG